MKIPGTLSYTWVLSLEDVCGSFVFCIRMFPVWGHSRFQLSNPSADGNDSLSPELSWPTLQFTGRSQENKAIAVILKMVPQGPYLGERTQAKKYLIIKYNKITSPCWNSKTCFYPDLCCLLEWVIFPKAHTLVLFKGQECCSPYCRKGFPAPWAPAQNRSKWGPALPMAAEQWEVMGKW